MGNIITRYANSRRKIHAGRYSFNKISLVTYCGKELSNTTNLDGWVEVDYPISHIDNPAPVCKQCKPYVRMV